MSLRWMFSKHIIFYLLKLAKHDVDSLTYLFFKHCVITTNKTLYKTEVGIHKMIFALYKCYVISTVFRSCRVRLYAPYCDIILSFYLLSCFNRKSCVVSLLNALVRVAEIISAPKSSPVLYCTDFQTVPL